MSRYQQVQDQLKAAPRRWLITGVAGFIGSHLLEKLLQLNQVVVGLDNFSTGTQRNLDEVRSLVGESAWKNFRFMEGDIRSLPTCQAACEGGGFVLHHAALGSVPRSIDDPIATHDNNVSGTLNMLVAARDQQVKRFVYATSSSTYGDRQELPAVEESTGQPLSPYAVSKRATELYAEVFSRCFQLPTLGLRYFNVFGPRQNPAGAYAAVIPTWINALLKNGTVIIYGDGETSRDFCYVANAVQANLLAAMTEQPESLNRVYNVAAGARTSLNQLFFSLRHTIAAEIPGLGKVDSTYRDFRAGDVRHSLASIKMARELLGYEPEFTVVQGLIDTLSWYSAQGQGQNRLILAPEQQPQ